MTPREHYEEAERLLALEATTKDNNEKARIRQIAEVHGRLANCPDWSVAPGKPAT